MYRQVIHAKQFVSIPKSFPKTIHYLILIIFDSYDHIIDITSMTISHEYFMQQALKEAHKALDADEVPIGAVIVMQDKIIARGYNQVETLNDATAHAEIIALTSAFNYLGSKYLPEAILYVTIEPCMMCCGAMYWSKIGMLVYGSPDPKHGGLSLLTSVGKHKNALHPKTKIVGDVLPNECVMLMKDFFKKRR